MRGAVYIEDHIGEVVQRTSQALAGKLPDVKTIRYMFGHPREIVARLQMLTNNQAPDPKFPIIMLFTDIVVRKERAGFYGDARLRIVLANLTKQDYTAPQRLEKNFKPILQPMKVEFLEQLYRHRAFTFIDEPRPTEIQRYMWGKDGLYGSEKNVFNDYLDCIELRDLLVTVKEPNCTVNHF